MYHSITYTIDGVSKNTWDDWHIIAGSRPYMEPPELKTKTLEIPGRDGVIDLTTSLTGYPVFNNRSGSHSFIVVNDFYQIVDTYEEWYNTYSKIANFIHGKKGTITLEDDPTYYYEGRFTVSGWGTGNHYSAIAIAYDVNPYKWYYQTSIEDSSVSSSFKNLAITTTSKTFSFTNDQYGPVPTFPYFTVTSAGTGAYITLINNTTGLETSSTLFPTGKRTYAPNYLFYGDKGVTVKMRSQSGTGTVSIELRKGSL